MLSISSNGWDTWVPYVKCAELILILYEIQRFSENNARSSRRFSKKCDCIRISVSTWGQSPPACVRLNNRGAKIGALPDGLYLLAEKGPPPPLARDAPNYIFIRRPLRSRFNCWVTVLDTGSRGCSNCLNLWKGWLYFWWFLD